MPTEKPRNRQPVRDASHVYRKQCWSMQEYSQTRSRVVAGDGW